MSTETTCPECGGQVFRVVWEGDRLYTLYCTNCGWTKHDREAGT
jgi:uncharacterized Zn finger protein